jgi:uncharacterized protein (DUF58 family)
LNYGNNAALLLTCLLGAAAGASVFFGFRVLSGLTLLRVRADAVHAGEALALHLHFSGGTRARPSLRLRCDATETAFAVAAGMEAEAIVQAMPARRGWFRLGRVRVWSDYPLGLFHLWSYLHPDVEFLVYPALETPAPPLPSGDGFIGDARTGGVSEEHSGLRDYRAGDPSRQIAWKASARHGRLLARDVERHSGEALTLDYAQLRGLDAEARIGRLAAWVIAAEAAQRSYTLCLPDATIGPSVGAAQRYACLRALAVLP